MDKHFLTEIADAFLVSNNVYSDFSKKDIEMIRERVITEVISLTKDLRDTDIELYNELWDKSKIFQQQVINDYLTYCFADEETLNESIAVIAVVTILSLIALHSKVFSKTTMKMVEKIGKTFEKIGSFLVRRGRFWKFRYAILQRNASQCYVKCGIKPEDVNILHYLNVGKPLPISTKKSGETVTCLQQCFLQYSIESIALQIHYYFVCVKKQGEFYQADKLNPDDILKVVSGVPLSAACKEFFDELKLSFDTFYDLLDFMYGDNERSKQDALIKLRDKVIVVRNEISKSRDFQKYK